MPSPEREPVVVCNTGPLIALAGVGQFPLLGELFEKVFIARAVYEEITHSTTFESRAFRLEYPWLTVASLPQPVDPNLLAELGRGEAETISLATHLQATRILIDERKGRRIAGTIYQLPVIGTGGILLKAKSAGHIDQVRPLLLAMKQNGYFLGDALVSGICQAAGE